MESYSPSHKRSFSDFKRETFPGSSSSKKRYDAFISHRGPDVKATVAFALYEALEEKECWTFLDDQKIKLGDSITSAIQDAINYSRVQIAIFSPRYAESSWCLDELVDMLKTEALFIPIFCDVKPADLRYPDKGVYKTAFAQHKKKKRFSNDKIDQWKAALHSSSLISGYEFSTSKDNVERLCTEIALAVQKEVGKHQKGLHTDEAASTSTTATVKKSSLLPRDSHPVGLETKVEHMVGLLEDPEVQVIAVVGMGGSGKTFLLQNIYKAVKSKYDHSIWLSISRSYSLKKLQYDISSKICLKSEIVEAKVTEEIASELIHDRLQKKRCLIVLDDLWELSTENSLIDKLGLPADKDCKVVISTRNRQVALNSNAQIYEMKNLSDEDSWKLFCVYAFPDFKGNRAPQHMEEEGRKIVEQCGNLPLAIKVIASSLANTRLLSKWELKRRQLEGVVTLIGDPDPVMEILKLSYDSLPAHLKPCFAYLSFFPEDEEIEAEYLINLWIAEGFIPAGEEQWDMAWDWLDQLAQLCLIQEYEDLNGPYLSKFCKIHDLLHDLAIRISKENKCVFSIEEVSAFSVDQVSTTGWCRILLAKKDLLSVDAISESRPIYLRTLSLYDNWEIKSIPENLFSAMRGLRVLDLSSTMISTLPESVGKMILLKVLNLGYTYIKRVPKCVRHLKSLLFLGIDKDCCQLPVWIGELKCLRHLKGGVIDRVPKEVAKLASLRTLRSRVCLSREEDKFMGVGDLINMTQLQHLEIQLNHDMQLRRIEEGILAQLVKLRHLTIFNNISGGEEREVPENITAMKHLESLRLAGFVMPSWICCLANLRYIDIKDCNSSIYPELQAMPNLVRLGLTYNKRCRELPKGFGMSGGFPELRFLYIRKFTLLEEFPKLEEGAMPCLERFLLIDCPRVKKVEGLEQLKRLEYFNYDASGVKNQEWETLQEGGEYWNKIKVINPYVTIKKD